MEMKPVEDLCMKLWILAIPPLQRGSKVALFRAQISISHIPDPDTYARRGCYPPCGSRIVRQTHGMYSPNSQGQLLRKVLYAMLLGPGVKGNLLPEAY